MYLRSLTKDEQHSFINIVAVLIMADKTIAKEEMQIFNEYLNEIGEVLPFNENANIDAELQTLKSMPTFKKKRVYFELLAVAKGDNSFAEVEKELMKKVQVAFEITEQEAVEIEKNLDKLNDFYKELNTVLN